jgi:hypothetical protein
MTRERLLLFRVAFTGMLSAVIAGGTYFTGNYADGMTGAKKIIFWAGFIVAVANNLHSFSNTLFGQLSDAIKQPDTTQPTPDKTNMKNLVTNAASALVIGGILTMASLTGCAWIQKHQGQINAISGVALDHIAKDAFNIAAGTLATEAQSGFSANMGYALQSNARDSLQTIVSSDSLKDYLNAWNNTATTQMAALVPPNLSPASAQQVALVIADSQAAAIPTVPQ